MYVNSCHNPYFSRWFSAIRLYGSNRSQHRPSQSLFQQMVFCNYEQEKINKEDKVSHNPYFSRWFSAIRKNHKTYELFKRSQSLFQQMVFCNIKMEMNVLKKLTSQSLFQQMVFCNDYVDLRNKGDCIVTILILVDGFLQ